MKSVLNVANLRVLKPHPKAKIARYVMIGYVMIVKTLPYRESTEAYVGCVQKNMISKHVRKPKRIFASYVKRADELTFMAAVMCDMKR
jgi:hypothetical protein